MSICAASIVASIFHCGVLFSCYSEAHMHKTSSVEGTKMKHCEMLVGCAIESLRAFVSVAHSYLQIYLADEN